MRPRPSTTRRPRIARAPRLLRRPSRIARSDRDSLLGPLGIAAVVASLVFLAAGIAWPQAAVALLRLYVLVLALGFVIGRAYQALLPVTARRAYSPFDGQTAARTAPRAPYVLRRLAADLGAANHARLARRTAIPRSVEWAVIDEAARRLAEHHGLRLDDPDQHARIRALVSEPTWLVIDPGDHKQPVPVSRLDSILDDLEKL